MAKCVFCAHRCGVNRLAGERGPCGAGIDPRFFSLQTEVSDEQELSPVFAIAFSGCDLRCPFCITAPPSWEAGLGVTLDPAEIAGLAAEALRKGARTVMILGGEPTIHLAAALDLVSRMPASACLAWKTNGRASPEARAWLEGLFDVWVVDYKFGNPGCAARLIGREDYAVAVRDTLFWAAQQGDLIVRHLVMPGHVDCCWQPVAAWLADHLPGVKVNLRSGFWPARLTRAFPELRRPVATEEARRAVDIARQCHLRLVA
jgi:putative pyruvate formate lyase activating enzyme